MHLFADVTRKSIPSSIMSNGRPPKLLIASTITVRSAALAISISGAMSLSRPVVVSQCTTAICVMEESPTVIDRKTAGSNLPSSPTS